MPIDDPHLMQPRGPAALREPLFILGTTRAGTTLLSLMLGHHPNIASCGEIEWPFDFFAEHPDGSLADFHQWLPLQRDYHFLGHKVDASLNRDDLLRSLLAWQYERTKSNKPRAVAQVHRHYAQVLALWPNAKFIHIVRDGRDVAASWMRFGWTGNGYVSALEWSEAVASWQLLRERIEPARRYEVRFEDLIQEPETHLGAMCALIGEQYHPNMLRYHEDTTYAPLNRAEASKWRSHLPALQVRLFESAADRALRANNYPLSNLPKLNVPPFLQPLLSMDDRFRRQRVRLQTFGAPLWIADQITRRLPLAGLHARVLRRMHDIINADLQ